MLNPLQQKTCGTESSSKELRRGIICIFPWLMIGCGMVLMPIWPVIHTIALRNLLLFSGGLIGLWYILKERSNLYQKPALPLLFISLLFIWLGTHYFLFAHNSKLEFEEISGTWLRTLFASFLGIGTGLFARNHNRARQAIWISIFFFVIIFYTDYAWVSFTNHNWRIPYRFDLGLFGNKISAVFHGIILLALCCAVISYQFIQTRMNDRRTLLVSIALVGLTFLAFVITGTKNGVALSLILILGLIGLFLTKANKSPKSILITAIFTILICLMSYLHLKLNPEWNNFFPSVAAGMQINKYPNWQNKQIENGILVLADGTVVGESAYVRTAFFIVGLKFLRENPLGYGLVDNSFKYLFEDNLAIAPQSNLLATHSGWLDFSLGLGIPGILLTWAAIAIAFFYSYQQESLWPYCTRWILAGTFLAWMFAEISSSHFVETLFYLITLLSAGNLPILTKDAYPDTTND